MSTTPHSLRLAQTRPWRTPLSGLRRIGPVWVAGLALWTALWLVAISGRPTVAAFPAAAAVLLAWIAVLAMRLWGPIRDGTGIELATVWTTGGMLALIGAIAIGISPTAAIAVPIVAVGAVWCRRGPTSAVLVLALFTAAQGSIRAFAGVSVGPLTDLLIAGLVLAMLWTVVTQERRVAVGQWPGLALLALFTLVMALQITRAESLELGLLAFRTVEWYLVAVYAIIFAGWPLAVYERLGRAMLALALAVGAYAVFRHFAGPAASELAIASAAVTNTVGDSVRLFGSFEGGHPLAVWCAVALPLCVAGVLVLRGRWRLIALAAFATLLFAVLATRVRAAVPGAVVGVALTTVLFSANRALPSGFRLARTVVAGGTVVVAAVALFVAIVGLGEGGERYRAIIRPSNDVSYEEHLYKWRQALDDISDNPLGHGLGSGGRVQASSGRFYSLAHSEIDSSYLLIAYDAGFVVMALFIVAVIVLLVQLAWRGVNARGPNTTVLAIGAAGSLASFAVLMAANSYIQSFQALWAWLIVALAIGAVTATRATDSPAPEPTAAHSR